MANFCENCGSPLNSDDRFCSNCGAPVNDDEVVNPVTPAAPYTSPAARVAPDAPRAPRSANPSARRASDAGGALPVNPATGAAAAATIGAFRPQPAPERPQESFVPPQHHPRPAQQPMPDNYSRPTNRPVPPYPEQYPGQGIPQATYNRPGEFARGGAGPRYEPDTDLQSMFLRYDNRLNRKRYILRSLALWAAVMILSTAVGLIATFLKIRSITMLISVVSLAAAIPGFMLVIRRLHDLDRPTWWCIGCIIPLVNMVLAVYLLFFKGTDGPNQFGPDPLEVEG